MKNKAICDNYEKQRYVMLGMAEVSISTEQWDVVHLELKDKCGVGTH